MAVPTARLVGHKEWARPKGRKGDPVYDMAAHRARVDARRRQLAAGIPTTPEPPEEDIMASLDDLRTVLRETEQRGVPWRYRNPQLEPKRDAYAILRDTDRRVYQLTGQVQALGETVAALTDTVAALAARLDGAGQVQS